MSKFLGKPKHADSHVRINTEERLKFGVPLSSAFKDSSTLPRPLQDMLQILYWEAPNLPHVLGVTPRSDLCGQLKRHLIRGGKVLKEEQQVFVISAVLKNFLQKIPESLLLSQLYGPWMSLSLDPTMISIQEVIKLLGKLPARHLVLLRSLLLVVQRVCQAVPMSLTTPVLAGFFLGPSLLWERSVGFAAYPPLEHHLRLARLVKFLVIYLDQLFLYLDIENLFPREAGWDCRDPGLHLYHHTFYSRNEIDLIRSLTSRSFLSAMSSSGPPSTDSLPDSEEQSTVDPIESCSTYQQTDEDEITLTEEEVSIEKEHIPAEASDPGAERFLKERFYSETIEPVPSPAWTRRFPGWNLETDDLPSWALGGFTLDLNDLTWKTEEKERLARKLIFEKLFVRRKAKKEATIEDLATLINTNF